MTDPASPARGDAEPAGATRPRRQSRDRDERDLTLPDDGDPPAAESPDGAEPAAPPVLTSPRDGTPRPIESGAELTELVARFAAGTGPVAIDAERASGYRYTHRAYLVQLRRAGSGTALIDPVALPELDSLGATIVDTEWVLHAASQDLACLAEIGLRPQRLFDTELAARLAGFERVGLAALTERLLGYTLEKHHSAADWSTRPLPLSWLTYAALDVELLIELRYALAAELERQGKHGWAAEEFDALTKLGAPRRRTDPWRRTSGIHKVRGARALARVRAMWQARDAVARRRDLAQGRVLPDTAIVAAAQADPTDVPALFRLPGFGGRATRRLARTWLQALDEARALPDDALPPTTLPSDGPPPPHRWAERDPKAAARLARVRQAVSHIAVELDVPPENLIAPDAVRRLAWSPPKPPSVTRVGEVLADHGARPWQIELTASALAKAL